MTDTPLKAARLARGWTQAQLATAAGGGLDAAAVSDFERQRRAPSMRNAVRLADALGVSLDALWGTGRPQRAPQHRHRRASVSARERR